MRGQRADSRGTQSRRSDHLRIALEEDAGPRGATTGFERIRLDRPALRSFDLVERGTSTKTLGHAARAPVPLSHAGGYVPSPCAIDRTVEGLRLTEHENSVSAEPVHEPETTSPQETPHV